MGRMGEKRKRGPLFFLTPPMYPENGNIAQENLSHMKGRILPTTRHYRQDASVVKHLLR
jgi:hypothetical protein